MTASPGQGTPPPGADDGLTPEQRERHIGRSFRRHDIEDACPCEQEPCGLVRLGDVNPACEQHPVERAKSIRQGHRAENCPDAATSREAPGRRLYDAAITGNWEAQHWRLLPHEDRETWIARAAEGARDA